MSEVDARERYLELLKDSLTGIITGQVYAPPRSHGTKAKVLGLLDRALSHWHLAVARKEEFDLAERLDGITHPLLALTQVGRRRLGQLEEMIRTLLAEGIEGDVLEAGCWRGGTGIFLRGALDVLGGAERTLWLADSFQGYPEPGPDASPEDIKLYEQSLYWTVSRAEVEESLERYRVMGPTVRLVEGFFHQSLPRAGLGKLAFLRVDVDGYEGVRAALEHAYPLVSPGGFVIVEDIGPSGAKRALDEHREREGLKEPLTPTPGKPQAVWFRRPR